MGHLELDPVARLSTILQLGQRGCPLSLTTDATNARCCGGGHKWDPVHETTAHGGGGVKVRLTRHFAFFADARYVLTDRTGNYGLGRPGLRFPF